MSTTTDTSQASGHRERADLVETLAKHRHFLRFTVRDLTEEQAGRATTASALTLSGLLKHVADIEAGWVSFILGGPEAMASDQEGNRQQGANTGGDATHWSQMSDPRFVVKPGTTLTALLARYDAVARRTDDVVATVDLDAAHPLPAAPWFEPGTSWSARRVLLHIIAETAQHAGHADIIRETLDGAKSMG
jgi:hypothetical protein